MTTVLMVDDNPADIDEMNAILTEAGFKTLTQPDGIHILDFLTSHPVDLIMLDLVMPKLNGIEILRELKKEFPTIPVIMCSAAGLEQVVALALRVGAAGYVIKPYQKEELLGSIEKVIAKR
jgi:two-component system response regulator AtoC